MAALQLVKQNYVVMGSSKPMNSVMTGIIIMVMDAHQHAQQNPLEHATTQCRRYLHHAAQVG